MRWVGIDEAGYGPNLGPLVMTAVVAESTGEPDRQPRKGRALDFWGELTATVDRAGGDPDRLWVDDSKLILRGGKGRDRLESACFAAVHAAANQVPSCLEELLELLGAGTLEAAEISPWSARGPDGGDGRTEGSRHPLAGSAGLDRLLARQPLAPKSARWRVVAVRSVIVGPARFNQGLCAAGLKSTVHFEAFERLLRQVWNLAGDGITTRVCGDKHGGRHYYFPLLIQAFGDAWIDRGEEGADISRYTIRDGTRRLDLLVMPRAEAHDGLVALASIVSKTVRELWMDVFNAYWKARVPELRPTAGYHTDAHRFRSEIEATAIAEQLDPALWWRSK
jgi:hypothetical protein